MNEQTTEQQILLGDSKVVLKDIKDGSIDLLLTDPPYGISFMGKDWDKALPDTEIWSECYRVLKEGSFIAVMSSTRSDVKWRMCRDLEEAGFDLSFTDLEWVYHTGFPKAGDTSKMLDKRLGVEREVIGENPNNRPNSMSKEGEDSKSPSTYRAAVYQPLSKSNSELGQKYEGSKLGFQPKPSRETIIIAMKPFKEKSYIDLVLNFEGLPEEIKMTYPLLQTPKPSKKEKDLGMTGEGKRETMFGNEKGEKQLGRATLPGNEHQPKEVQPKKNNHPTVKPVKLMSYLITLFTREGDWVLDPFNGSGTTGLASKLLNRNYIGIELEEDSYDISVERLNVSRGTLIQFFKDVVNNEEQTKLDL